MRLCTDCLHTDDRESAHCPQCGGASLAKLTRNGDVTTVPADAGMPCASCGEVDRELKMRYYRRVVGMLIVDQTWATVGYYCSRCRRRQFASNMGRTLLLGWWGLLAMLFRNPFAIAVNVWALFAAPIGADHFGAINVNDIRADAADERERHSRLADVYAGMPGWMETLSEDDIARVLTDVDYYEILAVSTEASHAEIRAAWRSQVKTHHPDLAGADAHEAMILVNDAWVVLGDERLRHAYDRRAELFEFLAALHDAEEDLDGYGHAASDDEPDIAAACRRCGIGFATFGDAADHVDQEHPHTAYADIIIDVGHAPDTDGGTHVPERGWACSLCDESFDDYDRALAHVDRAHMDRTVIDPRTALEVL